MIKEGKLIIILCILTLIISGCGPQKSPGEINVTVSGGFDAGWNQQYYEIDFGTIARCENKNSEALTHALEVMNNGLVPVNIDLKYTDNLFDAPDSSWSFKSECYAIGRTTGDLFGFAGNCWDGTESTQNDYIPITNVDQNVVGCLNYRSSGATTSPGVRIDVELNASCVEDLGDKRGLLAVTFEEANIVIDCGGDSGFDPGGV
jgi:hypothetical protein